MRSVLNKIIVGSLTLLAVSQGAVASSSSGDGSGFYIVPKAVIVSGDTIMHGAYQLDGETGVGIGVDLGYSFTENYALELALTHVEADVTEDDLHGHVVTDTAEYTTYGIVGVYSRTIVGHLRGLVKFGYAWEYEKMDHLHIKETLDGVTYAVGLEYGIADNIEVVLEAEGANVTSTRGESLLFGLKYKF